MSMKITDKDIDESWERLLKVISDDPRLGHLAPELLRGNPASPTDAGRMWLIRDVRLSPFSNGNSNVIELGVTRPSAHYALEAMREIVLLYKDSIGEVKSVVGEPPADPSTQDMWEGPEFESVDAEHHIRREEEDVEPADPNVEGEHLIGGATETQVGPPTHADLMSQRATVAVVITALVLLSVLAYVTGTYWV